MSCKQDRDVGRDGQVEHSAFSTPDSEVDLLADAANELRCIECPALARAVEGAMKKLYPST